MSTSHNVASIDRIAWFCHFAFWFGLVTATPIFLALHNFEDLSIGLSSFIAITFMGGLALSIISWKMADLTQMNFRKFITCGFLASSFILAVQGNLIHDLFEYGAFNGEQVRFRDYGLVFWMEFCAWSVSFPLVTWFFYRLSTIPAWMPAIPVVSFLALLIPSMLDTNFSETPEFEKSDIDPSIYAFSSISNLVHLLPDGFQGDVVRQVLEENPGLAKQFVGFTFFTDHLGRYPGTAPSLYTLLTGNPLDFNRGWDADKGMAEIRDNAYQNRLRDLGYQIDYVPISQFICVDGANSCHPRPFNDMKARGINRHRGADVGYTFRLITDLTLFRLSPMFFKEKIYSQGYWLFSDTTLDGSSPWPDPVLHEWSENIHIVDDRPVYKWYHYIGTHIPPKWDRQCTLTRDLDTSRENYLAQAYCILTNIGVFLTVLEDAGIYDKTAILITGDHGHNTRASDQVSIPFNRGMHEPMIGTARPALLVKKKNSREPLQFNALPSDLFDIAPTALSLAGLDTGHRTVFDVPERRSTPRIFQRYAIEIFWSGNPIPYIEYSVKQPAWDAGNWFVSDIRTDTVVPGDYDRINKETAASLMIGAQLDEPVGEKDAAWVRGRQLAFLIDMPDQQVSKNLELTVHLPGWMPEQTFTVQLNNGPEFVEAEISPTVDGLFWQTVSVGLPEKDQRPGRNFVSIVFDRTHLKPDSDDWSAAIFLKSIHVSDKQASTH